MLATLFGKANFGIPYSLRRRRPFYWARPLCISWSQHPTSRVTFTTEFCFFRIFWGGLRCFRCFGGESASLSEPPFTPKAEAPGCISENHRIAEIFGKLRAPQWSASAESQNFFGGFVDESRRFKSGDSWVLLAHSNCNGSPQALGGPAFLHISLRAKKSRLQKDLFMLNWLKSNRSVFLILALLFVGLEAFGHGISEADKQRMLTGGYLRYVTLGASHMLTGYDHLLFLFGVVFFLRTFKDIAKFVSVFTLGHCITLIFATFYKITMNYYLIDAVIAVSVMYKGFDNNGGFQKHIGIKSPSLIWMVFIFGLIHGFGLSTRLQQLPLGDDSTGMLIRILSFNVGVEVGQIAALAVMVAVLEIWRKKASFEKFSTLANQGIIAIGIFLFFMQVHGYWHDSHPNDFAFPVENHKHIHEDMELEKLDEESGRENL